MNDSFRIGSLFGIEVRMHILFVYMAVLLVGMAAMQGSGLTTAAFLAMLFALVLLHELAHSLVARRLGIRVIDIVLWPLGGMARMSEIPEDSRIEGLVAMAGPLLNVALAGLSALLLLITTGAANLIDPIGGQLEGVQGVLGLFCVVNLMLGFFNLLPAFPMDGGRILRAFLARKRSWLEATEIAVRVSRLMAFVMILSVFLPQGGAPNCAIPLIGLFVWWSGARELWATRVRHAPSPFGFPGTQGAGKASGPGAFVLGELLRRAAEERARGGGAPPPPQEPPPEEPPPEEPPPESPSSEEGPRRPSAGIEEEIPPRQGGFSDEDIRRMERFPGRLRRPPKEE